MSNMEMFKDDLMPPLTVDVTKDCLPLDLTTATSVTVVGYQNGLQIFSRLATSVAINRVTMNWQAADTDTIGPITIHLKVLWPTGLQTIQPDNLVMIQRV